MSLLMDALKKAEQEKRDAAKKLLPAEDDLSVTRREASADITDAHAVPAANIQEPQEPLPAEIVSESADRTYHTTSMDLSLEPLDASDHNPLIHKRPAAGIMTPATDPTGPVDSDLTHNVHAEKLSLQPELEQPRAETVIEADNTRQLEFTPAGETVAVDPDQTFHGVNLDQSVIAGLYEDTIQGEPFKPGETRSYDETLPGVPAAQLARDIGTQDQPTPVAAQTLFTATGSVTRPSSGFRWLLISLCVLAIGSAVIFYYYSVTPVSRNIPSPLVAKGVETILSSQDIQAAAGNIVPVPADTAATIAPATNTAAEAPATAPTPPPPAAVAVETNTPTPATAPETIEQPEATRQEVVAGTDAPASPVASPAAVEPARLPAVIEPPASLIRISRSANTAAEEGRLITDAFNAWQQGDYELARVKYQQVYEQSPDNRDVLLGLAAVAARTGDTMKAQQIYTRLVELNPLDSVARAALINLQSGEDASASISMIKSMLADSPEQPSLYFTLGRLYATQSNWAAAQQAFFDAYRLDSANPDYAFNLAVSLDRLNQFGSALDYYTVALGLSESSPAGFDRTAIADRIQTLEAGK